MVSTQAVHVNLLAPLPRSLLRRLRARQALVLEESRPPIQLLFVLRSAAAANLLWAPSWKATAATLAWSLITIAIYVWNGITDYEADVDNGSTRPLATRRLTCDQAARSSAILALGGLTFSAFTSGTSFAFAVMMLLLGWVYSAGPALKNRTVPSCAVIGAGAALTYAHSLNVAGRLHPASVALVLALSIWIGVGSVSKDFSDIEGDRAAGRRTWAVTLGASRAGLALGVCTMVVALGTVVWTLVAGASLLAPAVLFVGSIALAVSANKHTSAASRAERRLPYRAFFSTQLTLNMVMLLTGGF